MDSSLAAAILDRWGALEGVKQRFFSAFVSGEWWSGDASAHWEQLAAYVDGIAKQTNLLGVKRSPGVVLARDMVRWRCKLAATAPKT